MPYKDREKQKEAQRKAMAAKRAAEKAEQEAAVEVNAMGDQPTIEDAQAAHENQALEEALKSKAKAVYGRSQTWGFVFYPESCPQDWEERLRMTGVAFAVSPLHDRDLTKDGQPKKPHYHAILYWPRGATTYRTAEAITRGVLGGTIPIGLVSPRGYFRYFCHLDNPAKAQYDEKEVTIGNGFDVGNFLELTASEKAEIRHKLVALIAELGITEFWDLTWYAMHNLTAAEDGYIADNSNYFHRLLTSKREIHKAEVQRQYDEKNPFKK